MRVLLTGSGVAMLALIWLGPLPRLAAHSFSAHMTIHMGVVAGAAPLLAVGMTWGRRRAVTERMLLAAIVASVVELVVVWAWHTPVLHQAARTNAPAFAMEQAMFLASGYLVWFFAVAGGREGRAAAGAGVVALLLTSMHMTLLGALIALAPRPLYAHLMTDGLSTVARSAEAGGLDDQHLGGAIMLLVGGIVYLAGGLAVAARLVREPRRAAAELRA